MKSDFDIYDFCIFVILVFTFVIIIVISNFPSKEIETNHVKTNCVTELRPVSAGRTMGVIPMERCFNGKWWEYGRNQ